jgi:acyl-phosphate glycerol 3-phosphate acyltransferase
MTGMPLLALMACGAYLVGAVPFGYLVARSKGVDILSHGSGNIGATNVGRILGRRYGIFVFLLDFAKGALPVALAGLLAREDLPREWLQVTAGVAAFLGHLFPIYLGFRGGKGVATGAGVVAVLVPWPTAIAVLVWLAVVALTRYVSLASLVAAAVLCCLRVALTPEPWSGPSAVVTVFCLVAAALVAVRHRANIGRLLGGTENRLKEGPAMLGLSKTLHVVAIGLWFGSAVFFTAMGLVVFATFEEIAARPAVDRPAWLPLPALYDQARPSERFPEPLRKEQGTRIAGAVVGPLFPIYFALQTGCGVIAVLTAFSWSRSGPGGRLASVRATLLLTALICVVMGWVLEHMVSELRVPRDELTDQVLRASPAPAAEIAKAEKARETFVRWHLGSVLLNLATLGLVTVGMVLAAWLPVAVTPTDLSLATAHKEELPAEASLTPPG